MLLIEGPQLARSFEVEERNFHFKINNLKTQLIQMRIVITRNKKDRKRVSFEKMKKLA